MRPEQTVIIALAVLSLWSFTPADTSLAAGKQINSTWPFSGILRIINYEFYKDM